MVTEIEELNPFTREPMKPKIALSDSGSITIFRHTKHDGSDIGAEGFIVTDIGGVDTIIQKFEIRTKNGKERSKNIGLPVPLTKYDPPL